MEPAHPKHGPQLVASAQGWWPEVKSFLLRQFKRALGHEVRRWIVTGLGVLVVIFLLSPHLYLSLYHLATGYLGGCNVMISAPLPAQAGGQALAVPSQGGEGTGATQGGSAPLSSRPVGQPPLPPINSSGAQASNLSRSPALQPPIPPIGSSGAPAKPASTQNGDLLNQIGTGVKNYQSAVNTADQAKTATDKVKGLLGF